MSYRYFCFHFIVGILFLCLLAGATLIGCSGWTAEEKVRQGAYTALHVIDWAQTREIAAHPDQYHENNPALGEHPSKEAVDLYFAGTLAAHYLITDALPRQWEMPLIRKTVNPRAIWQYVSITIEAGAVGHNFSIGLRGEF